MTNHQERVSAAKHALREWVHTTGWGTKESLVLDFDEGRRPDEFVVTLPGEKKLRTTVSVLIGPRWVSFSAFVIRRPDENEAQFYRAVLRRNARSGIATFNVDQLGDVYLRAQIPTTSATEELFDEVFGVILALSDDSFNPLVALGFGEAIERERQWRTSRGEPLSNLAAFAPRTPEQAQKDAAEPENRTGPGGK